MATEPEGFPVTDPQQREVHCTVENWAAHEISHVEISGRSRQAADAIRDPLAIYQSHQKPTRAVYYRLITLRGSPGQVFLRVITDVDNNGVYWLASAHVVSRPDAREVLLWS